MKLNLQNKFYKFFVVDIAFAADMMLSHHHSFNQPLLQARMVVLVGQPGSGRVSKIIPYINTSTMLSDTETKLTFHKHIKQISLVCVM